MMRLYSGSSVEGLYRQALEECLCHQEVSNSRVGRVRDIGPACFEVDSSVLGFPLVKGRGLNPFFLLAEAAWVLGGRNELDILQFYLGKYGEYSDDGNTLNGAYGYRIKNSFGFNQLDAVIDELKSYPSSRRAVITLYSPWDLKKTGSKDIPCNISVLFKIRGGCLDITVFNRSNDIYMGVPYNLFIFQVIQFYVSKKLKVPLGWQRHISDSLHLYERDVNSVERVLGHGRDSLVDVLKKKSGFELCEELVEGYGKINSRQFDDLSGGFLIRAFKSFCEFREGRKKDILSLSRSDDIIGYAVNDWLQVHYG